MRETLDSILRQTFGDFEFIICDNASTDSTESICREYAAKDPRIKYHRNSKNLGAAPNYRKTFELSRGTYFKWAAYDDLVAPQFLEKAVAMLDQDTSVILVWSKTSLIDKKGAETRKDIPTDSMEKLRTYADSPHVRFRYITCIRHWSFQIFGLMRREVLARTPLLLDVDAHDRVLLAELSLMGKFYQLPEYLFYYRRDGQTSCEVYSSAYSRGVWFNPAHKGKVSFPQWRIVKEYLLSIRRVHLPLAEKVLCLFQILRYMRWNMKVLREDINVFFQYLSGINRKVYSAEGR